MEVPIVDPIPVIGPQSFYVTDSQGPILAVEATGADARDLIERSIMRLAQAFAGRQRLKLKRIKNSVS
jgi:hypothetical protein